MKYRALHIQTQREFPNNMRSEGFGWLVRAGYLTRASELTPLGRHALGRLQAALPLLLRPSLLPSALSASHEILFPFPAGDVEIIRCAACGYAERKELALFEKRPFSVEEPLPIEKIPTPDCQTIEALASYLNIPKEKTAKAMMFTLVPSDKFVFVVLRGDMALSETKLKNIVGEIRIAAVEEIAKAGAAAGYASPIGLTNALIVVDDLIPHSPNLVAGANEAGYHLLHTNCGRDYQPDIVADLALAGAGAACAMCGSPLKETRALLLRDENGYRLENFLLALAETYHDEKGLIFPIPLAPFDVYLMHVPGRAMDTRAAAEKIYGELQASGFSVLLDDRDERAGVKFNDADLIGCPLRVTVGERGLQKEAVEIKTRKTGESENVRLEGLASRIAALLAS